MLMTLVISLPASDRCLLVMRFNTISCSLSDSSSQDFEVPLDGKSNSERWTPQPPAVQHQHSPTMQVLKKSTAAVPRPAEDNVPHASLTLDKPRSRAPTTLKSQQPTQAARSTEPPFIGDSYMSEEAPAPRVSLSMASPIPMITSIKTQDPLLLSGCDTSNWQL